MLNLLQHYQKYHNSCDQNKSQSTSPTQLCAIRSNLNPRFRQYTNCVLSNPKSTTITTPTPKDTDLWIGVM